MGDPTLDPDLLAELTTPPTVSHAGCGVGRALAEMDDRTAATFREAMDRPDVRTVRLLTALRSRGFTRLGDSTVRRHRRGDCKCSDVGL